MTTTTRTFDEGNLYFSTTGKTRRSDLTVSIEAYRVTSRDGDWITIQHVSIDEDGTVHRCGWDKRRKVRVIQGMDYNHRIEIVDHPAQKDTNTVWASHEIASDWSVLRYGTRVRLAEVQRILEKAPHSAG